MCECVNIVTTNTRGVPYFTTTGVTVGTDNVDFTLGFRSIPRVGYITIRIADATLFRSMRFLRELRGRSLYASPLTDRPVR